MGNDPRVSVVMAVYNAERYLNEAIRSILGQTYDDFEFIIIDDGSTDRSSAMLTSFAEVDRRLNVHRQPNSGLIASLNKACGLARGAYVARMDADDISLPGRFEKQVQYLDAHKEIGVLGTWIQDIGADGQPGPVWPLPTQPATIRWFLMFGNCLAHPSVMMRRELIQSLAYRAEAVHVEDYDLWIRASSVTGVANIPEVLLRYRVLSRSVSSRHLAVQERQAAELQRGLRLQVVGTKQAVEPLTREILLRLYDAYRRKHSRDSGAESEIALDVLRRLYISGELRQALPGVLTLFPKLFSLQALRKAWRYSVSYARNIYHGFTTQRRVPE
jgi:glycosyltransferase involved in cell wall biosynthesis